MYCGKCGAQNQDGATFCGVCGAPLGAPAGQPGAAPTAGTSAAVSQDSGKYKKIGIAAVAVVAVVAIFGIFSLFGGRSDKETAEKFFDAVFDADADAIMDLIPGDLVDAAMEEGGYTREEVVDEFTSVANTLESSIGSLDFLGDGIKISYKAADSEDVDSSDLAYLKEQYDEADVDIDAARVVTVDFRVQADSFGLDQSTSFEIPVSKVGRSWYLDLMSF